MGHSIIPLQITEGYGDKSYFTFLMNFGEEATVSGTVWYIEGPKENIIVDTGCTSELFKKHGLNYKDVQSLEQALSKVHLKPEDINIVIISHLHFDHCTFLYKMPQAEVIVQEKELEFALAPHITEADKFETEFFIHSKLRPVNGDQEIVDGVKVLLTPGHTPGGQSVAIETDKGTAIITGFICLSDNFNPPEEYKKRKKMPIILPGMAMDTIQIFNSAMRVKTLADIIVPLNDIEMARKERIPEV